MNGTTTTASESEAPGRSSPEESQAQEPGPSLSDSDNLLVTEERTDEGEVQDTKAAEADDQSPNDQVSASEGISIVSDNTKLTPKPKILQAVFGKVLLALLAKQKGKKNDSDLSGNGGSTSERGEGSRHSAERTEDSKGENDGEISGIETEEMPNNKPPAVPKKQKKKIYQEDPKPKKVGAGKKRIGSESESGGDIDRKKKRKSRKSQPTHKKTNPDAARDEVADAIQNVCDGSDSRSSSEVLNKEGMSPSSYADRKRAYNNFPLVQDILKTFPEVSNYRILKRDFEKLREVDLQTLERQLEKTLVLAYHRHFANNYISPDPVIAAAVKHNKRHLDNKELNRDIQMLCFGFQKCKGKLSGTLYRQRSKDGPEFVGVTPTIDIQDTLGSKSCKITVYCEEIKFTQVPTFFDGVLCAYAIYWIFNMSYEKTAKGFFESFDSLIGK